MLSQRFGSQRVCARFLVLCRRLARWSCARPRGEHSKQKANRLQIFLVLLRAARLERSVDDFSFLFAVEMTAATTTLECGICMSELADCPEDPVQYLNCMHKFHLYCIGVCSLGPNGDPSLDMPCPECRTKQPPPLVYQINSAFKEKFPEDVGEILERSGEAAQPETIWPAPLTLHQYQGTVDLDAPLLGAVGAVGGLGDSVSWVPGELGTWPVEASPFVVPDAQEPSADSEASKAAAKAKPKAKGKAKAKPKKEADPSNDLDGASTTVETDAEDVASVMSASSSALAGPDVSAIVAPPATGSMLPPAAPPQEPPKVGGAPLFPAPLIICHDCGSTCEEYKARLIGKTSGCKNYRCSVCRTKITQLWRDLGSWPPQQFVAESLEKKQAFMKSLHGLGGKDAATKARQFLENKHTKERAYKHGGAFLPLSVWAKQGYDVENIEALTAPEDRSKHPVLGDVFRVAVMEKWQGGSHCEVEGDSFNAGTDPRSVLQKLADMLAGNGGLGMASSSSGGADAEATADKNSDSDSDSSSASSSSDKKKKKKSKKKKDGKKAKRDKKRAQKEKKKEAEKVKGERLDQSQRAKKRKAVIAECTRAKPKLQAAARDLSAEAANPYFITSVPDVTRVEIVRILTAIQKAKATIEKARHV